MVISIPDDVFGRAERLARKQKVSRSQLYTAALIRMLEAESKDELTDELTRAFDSAFADDALDPLTSQAARAVFADVEWSDGSDE